VSRVLPTGREIARHEANHAAALCMAGLVPKCVRTDWPSNTDLGAVTIDWGDDGINPTSARGVLIAIVLGATTEGFDGWNWESWPIDPEKVAEGTRRDAQQARILADYLELDRFGWAHILWQANRLARRQDFRRLVVAIADELERVEVLHAADLEELMARDSEEVAA
jgi:hypothetical protein